MMKFLIIACFLSLNAIYAQNGDGIPPLSAETQLFSDRVLERIASNNIDLNDLSHVIDLFSFFDHENDEKHYNKFKNTLYKQVTQEPLNGVLNGDYAVPCIKFLPTQYADDSPILIFFHGGGFIISDFVTYRATLTHIAAVLKVRIVYVEHRLAPEHAFPTGSNDCLAAAQFIVANKLALFPNSQNAKIGLFGDSAGGNAAAFVANELTKSKVAFQILVYPTLSLELEDLDFSTGSIAQFNDNKYILPIITSVFFNNFLVPAYGLVGSGNTQLSPLYGSKVTTPEALIVSAQLDGLIDQAYKYKQKLEENNVNVRLHKINRVTHFFFQYPFFFPDAFNKFLTQMNAFLVTLKPKK